MVSKCKWITAYISSRLNKKSAKPRFDLYDMEALNDPIKFGMLPPEEEKILESPQNESHLAKASDEVIFYGVNSSSECFVARISRRSSEKVEIGLYIKLKNGSIYQVDEVCCSQKTLKCSNRMFIGGGLKMHYVEPMRKWRLHYKGLLRQISTCDEIPKKMVYVKFNLQWRASTDCFDTLSDIRCSQLAEVFSKVKWNGFLPDIRRFQNAVDLYSQCGVIRGEVFIDGVHEVSEIYLFGGKIRYLGNAPRTEGYRFSHVLGHIAKNGRMVHIAELHIPQIVESFVYGYVVTPDGKIEVAKNLKKDQLLNGQKSIDMKFYTDELDFNLKIDNNQEKLAYQYGVENEYFLSMKNIGIELNSSPGRGIFITGTILKPQVINISKPATRNIQEGIPLVVGFSDSLCHISDISGGKGSSLGKLTQLSQIEKTFVVPKGIVVTTAAYENFLTENICKEVKNLSKVLYGNSSGDIKQVCDRTMEAVTKANIPDALHKSIVKSLQTEFGDDFHQKMFAIRSSTTGEDNDEMSAAGQMETYLGVSGLETIMLSVKKCWASQFSHRAVEYKRQNGQVLNSPMAVVIQQMVFCEVAGVLLTCDPVTGNPILMNISANYGLGESVVSGTEEPDTIILERSPNGELKIKEKIIGSKEHRSVIKDGNLSSQKTSEAEKSSCSLSDSLSLRLGSIAINIEKYYGCESDIEWGCLNNDFYIFQCRPVTTNNVETDYEIEHENDSPMRVENEYFTVCNVGEVMPGATSPLGLDIMLKFFSSTLQRKIFSHYTVFSSKYCPKGIVSMYNHSMMMAAEMFGPVYGKEALIKSTMIALFGRIIDDEGLLELGKERYQHKKKINFMTMFFVIFTNLHKIIGILKRTRKNYERNRLSFEGYKTADELHEGLIRSCTYPVEALICHMLCTNASTLSNSFLFSLIEKAKGDIDSDVYSDVSELLASMSEVESADVPLTLENLAHHISKDFSAADFRKMDIEDAESFLMSSTSESGQKFRDFLKKHGHRCLKEFDVRTPTWEENPKQLIKLLQSLTGNISKDSTEKKTKTFEEIVSNLKIPLSRKTRLILKFILLPMCRSAVRSREAAKSILIMAIHQWRKGYKRLAKLMVSEGRIPDEDLLFFMSLLEIQEILRTRSPKIISRALRRKKVYPVLDSYIFPEITSGIPKPVNIDTSEVVNSSETFSMKGIPVSRGFTKGFLRVAFTLEEASFLQPGEILLTYSTDIGWTPYFPILGGVATELGGLISHGAVVSREYGLPCIAGLHGATRQFQTGDYVLMDANKGILQKLPSPQ